MKEQSIEANDETTKPMNGISESMKQRSNEPMNQ
jgi:hypothetical protein